MAGFFDILKEPPVPYPGTEDYPLFNRISIETISYCNRSCHFCPVAWSDRGKTSMSEALYAKIVDELHKLEFDGVAQLFLLSEPMIDRALLDRALLLRTACPQVSIYISTNGDVLDKLYQTRGMEAALERLNSYYDAGVTVVNINSYDPGPDQLERYKLIEASARERLGCRHTEHKYRHHTVSQKYLCVTDMRFGERASDDNSKVTDVFYIRNAKDRLALEQSKTLVPQTYCMRTQRHIVVLFDGRVPICCAIDPNDTSLLVGDINKQTLHEVWQSDVFFRYRWYTQRAKRVLAGCSTCTHKMAFPHVVRKIQPSPEKEQEWYDKFRDELQKKITDAARSL